MFKQPIETKMAGADDVAPDRELVAFRSLVDTLQRASDEAMDSLRPKLGTLAGLFKDYRDAYGPFHTRYIRVISATGHPLVHRYAQAINDGNKAVAACKQVCTQHRYTLDYGDPTGA